MITTYETALGAQDFYGNKSVTSEIARFKRHLGAVGTETVLEPSSRKRSTDIPNSGTFAGPEQHIG